MTGDPGNPETHGNPHDAEYEFIGANAEIDMLRHVIERLTFGTVEAAIEKVLSWDNAEMEMIRLRQEAQIVGPVPPPGVEAGGVPNRSDTATPTAPPAGSSAPAGSGVAGGRGQQPRSVSAAAVPTTPTKEGM